MAAGVHTALIQVLARRLGEDGARTRLQQLADSRQYVRDVWS
jgi:sulfite reductase alpha subunit-like flavoprotein